MIILIGFIININNKILKKTNPQKIIVDTPKTLVIINNTDYNIEQPTKIILNDILCRDSLAIKFEYMDEKYRQKYSAFVIEDIFFKNQYIIYITPYLKGHKLGITLAHELIHVDQFESGNLKQYNLYKGIYIFNSDTINTNIVKYNDRPYEIDAMNREEELYFRTFKFLYK